jgi:type I restriction-modification system DNA methylase subunit
VSTPSALVQKLWNYCNILRDDGLSYGDYVEPLTFLLFLKMADAAVYANLQRTIHFRHYVLHKVFAGERTGEAMCKDYTFNKKEDEAVSDQNPFLLYTAPNGDVKVEVFFKDETVWLTQKALADLFGVKVPAINKHLKNIFVSGELTREATISKMEIVRAEDGREVAREVEFYNLDAIIAVGYRVNVDSAEER